MEATRACLDSVYRLSGDARGRVIAVHDPSPEAAMLPMLRKLQDEHPDLVVLCNETRLGFVRSCNRALLLSERDVVLLHSDTLVTEGWLTEMIDVLHVSDRIASVAPLCLDRELNLRGTSIPRASDIPANLGPCLLLRYWVLNVIGGFDLVFGRSDDSLIDWAMRAQCLGLRHVRANRAVVLNTGSFTAGQVESNQEDASSLLLARHPHHLKQLQGGLAGSEVHAAEHFVSSKLGPLRVFIDLRSLGRPARNTAEDLARHLGDLPDTEVELGDENKQGLLQLFQVLYRPGSIADPRDLVTLLESPCHLVLGIDDLRPYDTPALFASPELHLAWRALLFSSTHSAQAVVALSNHARVALIADLALDPALVEVVPPPIDQLSLPQTAVRLASIFRRAVDHPSEKSLRHRKLLANFARSMASRIPPDDQVPPSVALNRAPADGLVPASLPRPSTFWR